MVFRDHLVVVSKAVLIARVQECSRQLTVDKFLPNYISVNLDFSKIPTVFDVVNYCRGATISLARSGNHSETSGAASDVHNYFLKSMWCDCICL